MKKLLYLIVVLSVFASCTPSRSIAYKKTGLLPLIVSVPITVEIKEFIDQRSSSDLGVSQLAEPRTTKKLDKKICMNSEKHYKKNTVASQFSKQIAEHFEAIALFDKTTFGEAENVDYYITGNLVHFYGEQEFSNKALVGSQFGLIGALATASVKTQGEIVIEVSDLKLFKKNGELVKDLGSFKREYSEKMSVDGYCWCIYGNINEKLKDFNDLLAEKIQADLKSVKF